MIDKPPIHDTDPSQSLERVLRRDRGMLEDLITTTGPLSVDNLRDVDAQLADVAHATAQSALQWPDAESFVPLQPDSPILGMTGKDADLHFVLPIAREGSAAYNNLFAILASKPEIPSEDSLQRLFTEGMNQIYGTKPYLVRAHTLLPEFMGTLQRAVSDTGSMARYNDQLVSGMSDPEFDPSAAALLTGSRIAYALLAHLMRSDDMRIHYAMLRLPAQSVPLIESPEVELRT